jgi:peptidyl-prolyl cis-trans isomerase C
MKPNVALKSAIYAVTTLLLATGPLHAGGTKESSAVASVNGVLIPKEYFRREISRFEERVRSQGEIVDESRREEINRQALDTLIDVELLYQESQRRGFQITQERIDEKVNDLGSRYPDEEAFGRALEEFGISRGELRTEFERQIAIQDMIDTDIAPSISVSEHESKDFYLSNPDFFFTPEQVRASHILVLVGPDASEEEKAEARSRIEEIRRMIVAGEDFAEAAARFSEDGNGGSGGDLGFFRRDQMVEPFADAAFALEIGQLSGVVTTQYGYHLIQVTDRKEEATIPFEAVQARIFEYLHREKVMVAVEELAGRLRGLAEIEEYPLEGQAER